MIWFPSTCVNPTTVAVLGLQLDVPTFIAKCCKLISFSWLVAKSHLHMRLISSVSKIQAIENVDISYGSLLKVDVNRHFKK